MALGSRIIKKNCSITTVPQHKYETKKLRVSGRAVRVQKKFDRTSRGKGSWNLVWNLELEGRGRKPHDVSVGQSYQGKFYFFCV